MAVDSFLDPDVMAGNPLPYRLLSNMPIEQLIQLVMSIRAFELEAQETGDYEAWRAKGQQLFREIPELANEAASLAEEWAAFMVHRKQDWAIINLLVRRADFLAERTMIENDGLIRTMMAEGTKPILISLHLDAYQGLPPILAANGLPVATLMDRNALPLLDAIGREFYPQVRSAIRPLPLPAPNPVRSCMKALDDGYLLTMFCEFTLGSQETVEEASFLGRRIKMPLGPARLAAAAGSPIVPVTLQNLPNCHYKLAFEAPLFKPGEDVTVNEVTRRIGRWMEQKVRLQPHRWWCWEIFQEMMASPVGGSTHDEA